MGEIKAALSPEEWAEGRWVRPEGQQPFAVRLAGGAGVDILSLEDDVGPIVQLFNAERHPLAALALHGQAFGFTWADVDDLRSASASLGGGWFEGPGGLADRIAALLPPREETTQ